MKFYRPLIKKKNLAAMPTFVTPEAYNQVMQKEAAEEADTYSQLDATADEYFIKKLIECLKNERVQQIRSIGIENVIEDVPLPEDTKLYKAKEILQELKTSIKAESGEHVGAFDSAILFKLKDKYYKVYYELLEVRRLLNTGVKPPEIIKMIQEGEVLAV